MRRRLSQNWRKMLRRFRALNLARHGVYLSSTATTERCPRVPGMGMN